MKWKLRIPLILFVLGLFSGIYQYFPNVFLLPENYWFRSFQYIGTIGIIIYILEKTEINEKKVHFILGILLILAGILIDSFMVG